MQGDCAGGKGTFNYAGELAGQHYRGEWKNSLRHGWGVHHYVGGRYEGLWEKDQRQGEGTYESSSGHRYRGGWHNDQRMARASLLTPMGIAMTDCGRMAASTARGR